MHRVLPLQDTCHVIRDHEENKQSFAGPRFLIGLPSWFTRST